MNDALDPTSKTNNLVNTEQPDQGHGEGYLPPITFYLNLTHPDPVINQT